MPKGPKAPKTWYTTSALFFLAVGAFYLAGALPFVDTGILAAQFTFFGRPATLGPLIATILTATALFLVYALVRRVGRSPSRLRRRDDTVHHRQTMMNGAVDHSSDGILFTTDREYRVGTELLVRYPFPSSSSPKQKGTVLRVEELPDGRRQVAVRLE